MGGGGGGHGAQPAARADGRHRRPAADAQALLHQPLNTFLDAIYFVPQQIGSVAAPAARRSPRKEQIYFIGATNVPLERLDPALVRPGRMGRHVWFRTPTKDDRKDIFDLYLAQGRPRARPRHRQAPRRAGPHHQRLLAGDDRAGVLDGADLRAPDGRAVFGWGDIVEAMTTVESGTAVGVEYVPEETRAVAIHEAGHAAAGHVYMKDRLSTRLSIRMRGGSLGHHQAIEKEERFSALALTRRSAAWSGRLGAMAAERVFYGENTPAWPATCSATRAAALMVGLCGMAPEPRRPRRALRHRGGRRTTSARRS